MPDPQSAPRTFLLTDIEGSTRLWEEHRAAMVTALETHDRLLAGAVAGHGGTVVKSTGDGMLAVFADAATALAAAAEAQRALAAAEWGEIGSLRVRMAVHHGVAHEREGDYYGPTLNRVARLLAIAHGGQVVASGAAAELATGVLPAPLALADQGEHRLRDLDRAEHVFQLIGPDLTREFPPLRSLGTFRTNLPSQLTTFVGREEELAGLRGLAPQHRLVTLIGTGGTGKTRLMIQAGAELLEEYEDGVWLVELAAVTDPDLILDGMAHALGVSGEPGQSMLDAVADFCRTKRLLVLLDNCEHLVQEVAAMLQRLLPICPRTHVMATSREALGTDGEVVFQVPSLGIPAAVEDHEPDALLASVASSESGRLFIDRATAALPSFALDASNAPSVAEICRRLDGIPLAIELAAARVNVLSPSEIAEGLGDRFRLLTGGRRTALPRQQTLQALVDWSWDLLEPDDQQLLARLSVFAGSWTLDAAAAVAGGEDGEAGAATRIATLDGLSRLVDRSLVVVDHAGATRYRMLETIRQYAREKLIARGEIEALRNRHLAWFGDLAATADASLHGPEQLAWLVRLDPEIDNFRAALDWASEADPEQAIRLGVHLMSYWRSRSFGPEAVERLTRLVDLARSLPGVGEDRERTMLAVRALAGAGFAQAAWGSGPKGRVFAEEAVTLARATGDDASLLDALFSLRIAMVYSGDTEAFDPSRREAIELAVRLDDLEALTFIQAGVAAEEMQHGDLTAMEERLAAATDAAERSQSPFATAFAALTRARTLGFGLRSPEASHWFEVAIDAYEAMGDRRFALIARSDLGHSDRLRGAFDEAEEIYRRTIHDWQHAGNRGAVAHQLECFGAIALERGAWERATRLLGAGAGLREAAGAARLAPEQEEFDAWVKMAREHLEPAAFEATWTAGRALTSDEAVAVALTPDSG